MPASDRALSAQQRVIRALLSELTTGRCEFHVEREVVERVMRAVKGASATEVYTAIDGLRERAALSRWKSATVRRIIIALRHEE